MATTQDQQTISLKAAADLSTKQHYFVELTAAKTVNVCNAVTDLALGVLCNKPSALNQAAQVAYAGTTKVVAAAAIAMNAKVAPAADGRAQTAVATQFPRAVALEAAGAAGDIIEVLLLPIGPAI